MRKKLRHLIWYSKPPNNSVFLTFPAAYLIMCRNGLEEGFSRGRVTRWTQADHTEDRTVCWEFSGGKVTHKWACQWDSLYTRLIITWCIGNLLHGSTSVLKGLQESNTTLSQRFEASTSLDGHCRLCSLSGLQSALVKPHVGDQCKNTLSTTPRQWPRSAYTPIELDIFVIRHCIMFTSVLHTPSVLW